MCFSNRDADGFDWVIDFAEVFVNGGFHVVLANPPYVRMELFKEIKPILKKRYPTVHAERADLYCYFYARAIEMLADGGMVTFISSDKWLRAGYGANLRGFVSETCAVAIIVDFGELPVFEAAATFPMIFVAKKARASASPLLAQVKSLDSPYPDVSELVTQIGNVIPADSVKGGDWKLRDPAVAARMDRMEKSGVHLSEYVKGQIYYGIKTGLDEAFVVDGATKNRLKKNCNGAGKVIKPLVYGDNVRRWRIDFQDTWLLYMRHGIETENLKSILDHMRPLRRRLENRATQQEWYELQQPSVKYAKIYGGPKIIYPEIAKEPRFTVDEVGYFPLKTVFSIPSTEMFLLGVLNSSPAWEYLKNVCSVLGDAEQGGRLTLQAIYVGRLPIPNATDSEKSKITGLVRKCLDANGKNCEMIEHEIDELVAKLYGVECITKQTVLKAKSKRSGR